MSRRIYGYLRASTDEQDATRAKSDLQKVSEEMLAAGLKRMKVEQNFNVQSFLDY
jgi:DNA invertase Pin-like site-specific DNA recombinase